MNKQDARTVPAMPAAKKQKRTPTLMLKMPVEDREEEKKKVGRYSIIPPRDDK